jgi:hypothetical protein
MSLSNTASQLRTGLENRIRAEEALKQNIIQKINDILRNLRDCDRTGLPPAAAAALDLTQQELDDILALMSDTTNLNDTAAENVVGELRRQAPQLRKNPDGTRPRTMFNRVFGTARPAGPAGPSAGPAGPSVPPVPPVPPVPSDPAGPPPYSSVAPQVKSGWSLFGKKTPTTGASVAPASSWWRGNQTRRDRPITQSELSNELGDIELETKGQDDNHVRSYNRVPLNAPNGLFGQPIRTQQNHIGGWTPKRKPKRPRKTRKN